LIGNDGMNLFEVGDLEPHEPRHQSTGGHRKLFWLLMVIVGGLTLGLIIFCVLGLLVVSLMLSG